MLRVLWQDDKQRLFRAIGELSRHRVRRRAEILTLYDTGCRVAELAAADVGDYDQGRRSLILMNVKSKKKARREVGLHGDTVRALNAWLRQRPNTTAATTALFVSQKGTRLSIRQIQEDYTLLCTLAGITPTGVHTLRHSSATNRLDDHILDVHQVSRRLGHTSIRTTIDYYIHGDPEREALQIRNHRL